MNIDDSIYVGIDISFSAEYFRSYNVGLDGYFGTGVWSSNG